LTHVVGSIGIGLLYVGFNSVDCLTDLTVGANLCTPGKAVNRLPFKFSNSSRRYLPDHTYSCQQ
jgi:hypothetical protein